MQYKLFKTTDKIHLSTCHELENKLCYTYCANYKEYYRHGQATLFNLYIPTYKRNNCTYLLIAKLTF